VVALILPLAPTPTSVLAFVDCTGDVAFVRQDVDVERSVSRRWWPDSDRGTAGRKLSARNGTGAIGVVIDAVVRTDGGRLCGEIHQIHNDHVFAARSAANRETESENRRANADMLWHGEPPSIQRS
jgi:hypothetical protein